jgi:pimeloyl-ACP methyl ester carboxylesterase
LGQVLVGAAWQRTELGSSDDFVANLRRDYTGALRSFIDNSLPETDSVELKRWGLQMLTRSSVDDAVELLRCREQIVPADQLADQLCSLTLPTLLFHGDIDRIVPPQSSRLLAGHIPHAELHVLPGLGHVPIVTAPAQVASLIDAFGKRLPLPTPIAATRQRLQAV